MNGDRLGVEGFHRRGKFRMFNQHMLISSSWNDRETVKRGNSRRSVIEPGMRLGNRHGGTEEKKEINTEPTASLTGVVLDKQGVPARVGNRGKTTRMERKIKKRRSVLSREDENEKQVRLPQEQSW